MYESLDEVLEAALVAVEERTTSGFDGTDEELESLLLEGMDSGQLGESEFWEPVNRRTDVMLAERASGPRSWPDSK